MEQTHSIALHATERAGVVTNCAASMDLFHPPGQNGSVRRGALQRRNNGTSQHVCRVFISSIVGGAPFIAGGNILHTDGKGEGPRVDQNLLHGTFTNLAPNPVLVMEPVATQLPNSAIML